MRIRYIALFSRKSYYSDFCIQDPAVYYSSGLRICRTYVRGQHANDAKTGPLKPFVSRLIHDFGVLLNIFVALGHGNGH